MDDDQNERVGAEVIENEPVKTSAQLEEERIAKEKQIKHDGIALYAY